MPRYEYECQHCGAGVELSRSIEERRDPLACPTCGGEMDMVPSLTAFALKGGGWTPKGSIAAPPQAKRPMRGYDMTGSRLDD